MLKEMAHLRSQRDALLTLVQAPQNERGRQLANVEAALALVTPTRGKENKRPSSGSRRLHRLSRG